MTSDNMSGRPQTRALFVWEQGTGLGHLSQLRLPMEVALAQGAAVFLAARELPGVREVLAGLPITLLQAPFRQGVKPAPSESFLSYTHLLGRQCFGSADELEMYVRAWRALFALVQPDICPFEHSSTALIAAFGYTFKKVLLGSGFMLPPASALSASPFLPFPTTLAASRRPQCVCLFAELSVAAHLLRDLQGSKVCALLLVRDLPPELRAAFSSRTLRFVDHMVDLSQVPQKAAWVVHHGNHSTMATFMQAGLPQLVIPRHQEQLFGSLRLVSRGCAVLAFQDQPAFGAAISALQTNPKIRHCAVEVASQCVPFDQNAVRSHMRETFSKLLPLHHLS